MPRIDVIIPAYNAAHFLPTALDSVVAQSFQDWRILLIDDGSIDDTAEVVAPYRERLGEKLKYIRQANAGLPAARNAAIRNSTAELLALLDADDVWLSCRLEESLKCFEGRPRVGLAYGLNAQIDLSGAVTRVFDKGTKYPEGQVASKIYTRSMDLPCPTVTFRRQCVEDVGLFDESLRATEDRDLWLRIAQSYEVAMVPKIIAHYRVSPQAMTTDPYRMFRAQIQFVEKHYGSPGCGFFSRRMALSSIHRQRAEALADRKQMTKAVADSFRAWAYYPFAKANTATAVSLLLRWIRQK